MQLRADLAIDSGVGRVPGRAPGVARPAPDRRVQDRPAGRPDRGRGRGIRAAQGVAAGAASGRLGRRPLAGGVRRPRRDAGRVRAVPRDLRGGRRPRAHQRHRAQHGRADADRARHARPAGAAARDPLGRDDLVPALQRARGRLGSRSDQDPGPPPAGRLLDRLRPEGVDVARPGRRSRPAARPHRRHSHRLPGAVAASSSTCTLQESRYGGCARWAARRTSARCSSTTSSLPADAVIGQPDDGWGVATNTLGHERTTAILSRHASTTHFASALLALAGRTGVRDADRDRAVGRLDRGPGVPAQRLPGSWPPRRGRPVPRRMDATHAMGAPQPPAPRDGRSPARSRRSAPRRRRRSLGHAAARLPGLDHRRRHHRDPAQHAGREGPQAAKRTQEALTLHGRETRAAVAGP